MADVSEEVQQETLGTIREDLAELLRRVDQRLKPSPEKELHEDLQAIRDRSGFILGTVTSISRQVENIHECMVPIIAMLVYVVGIVAFLLFRQQPRYAATEAPKSDL